MPTPTPPPRSTRRSTPRSTRAAVLPVGGSVFLVLMLVACLGSLPWTLGRGDDGVPRYNRGDAAAGRLPPSWITPDAGQFVRLNGLVSADRLATIGAASGVPVQSLREVTGGPAALELRRAHPRWWLGTDVLGRSLLLRLLTGGGISLVVGVAAAVVSVVVGTLYGAAAGWLGGRADALMMRAVDVLYGLPYVLLVVLLAVASDALVEEYASRGRARERWTSALTGQIAEAAQQVRGGGGGMPLAEVLDRPASEWPVLAKIEADLRSRRASNHGVGGSAAAPPAAAPVVTVRGAIAALGEEAVPRRAIAPGARTVLDLCTLLAAIGGVSWLTMARVIRGQVLSLKARPFIEAARAMGASGPRVFFRHLLPNLAGPIAVYATLTVPQAIMQESFLSFLGIGVKPPLPSWGTLAADGLGELNPYQSNWWLLVFPCALLALTLMAMNFVGEGLRARLEGGRG